MSGVAQGIVQAMQNNPRVFNTPYGAKYNLKFKLSDGQWYVIKYCKVEEAPPVQQGASVTFRFESEPWQSQNGRTGVDNTVDRKSLTFLGNNMNQQQYPQQQGWQGNPQPQQQWNQPPQQQQWNQPPQQPPQQQWQQPQPQQTPQQHELNSQGVTGTCVGAALNQACNLLSGAAISDSVELINAVERLAVKLIRLSDRLNDEVKQGMHDYRNDPPPQQHQQPPAQNQEPQNQQNTGQYQQQQNGGNQGYQQPQGQQNPNMPQGFDAPPPRG